MTEDRAGEWAGNPGPNREVEAPPFGGFNHPKKHAIIRLGEVAEPG